jgi:hypothetical protein
MDIISSLDNVARVGFIPYTNHNNKIIVLLGIDMANKKYSDFGGRCSGIERAWECGLRELQEETRNVLEISQDNIDTILLTSDEPWKLEMLVKINYDKNLPQKFKATLPTRPEEDEIESLKWMEIKKVMNIFRKDPDRFIRPLRDALENL